MRVSSIDAAPAEMVGEPWSLCALHQLLQPAEVFAVGLLCRSEIHRDSVLHDLVLIEYLIQNVQRPAAVNHEILGDNFKPVDDGFTREDMLIVRSAQANSNPVISKPIKATFRHILFRSLE